jgi:hypothetical protein
VACKKGSKEDREEAKAPLIISLSVLSMEPILAISLGRVDGYCCLSNRYHDALRIRIPFVLLGSETSI